MFEYQLEVCWRMRRMWTVSLGSGMCLGSAVGVGVFIYRYELVFIWGKNWHYGCEFLGRDNYFEECPCVYMYSCRIVFVLFGGFSI